MGSLRTKFGSAACFRPLTLIAAAGTIGWPGGVVEADDASGRTLEFNRDVRPILSRHCFGCHGRDEAERKGDLRLDLREVALETEAIVPGNAEESELVHRLHSDDPDEVMPPPGKGEALSVEQIATLEAWIAQGAAYQPHWAWIPPASHPIPEPPTATPDFPIRSSIDAFILAKLGANDLGPAPAASKESWLRRVTLDLTGLPPSLAEIDAFLADSDADAFRTVVDRLLASDAFGEHFAADWLDVARYGDTYGRHEDFDCVTWPWRDWVIDAFNRNLPYDRFILLQTAGDLLPGASQDEIVPTAFNRLHMQMNEAGSNPEEFRWENVFDRVKTNGLAFLGLTMECARCHDHKYDPITMADYFGMAAFFDNIDELGLYCRFSNGTPPPTEFVFSKANRKRHDELVAAIAKKATEREDLRPEAEKRFEAWLESNRPPAPDAGKKSGGAWSKVFSWFKKTPPKPADLARPIDSFSFEALTDRKEFPNLADPKRQGTSKNVLTQTDGPEGFGKALFFEDGRDSSIELGDTAGFRRTDPFTLAAWVRIDGDLDEGPIVHRTRSAMEAAYRGYELTIENNHLILKLAHFWPGNAIALRSVKPLEIGEWTHVAGTYDGSSRAGGMRLYLDGQPAEAKTLRDSLTRDILYLDQWRDNDPEQVPDGHLVSLELRMAGRINSKSFRNGALDEVRVFDRDLSAPEIALVAGRDPAADPEDWLEWYLREIDEPWRKVTGELQALREEENALTTGAVELMVMREMAQARETPRLERGQWNRPGEAVTPGVPAFLPPFPDDQPRNRLGFARWLIDPAHPLTSRVAVNRIWQQFFGTGIVATTEDFGTQGELPSHPELLDWLAIHFRENGWDTKALCREIVLSSTYRQSTLPADRAVLEKDPSNRLLARAPKGRLTAEQLRDQALFAAGVLHRKIGGPSVKPYLPAGSWSGTQHEYRQDSGDALYRRSLYTFWRRTMPPPNLQLFDAPSREFCQPRREETENPLQALVLLNDPQYVEAARLLAEALVTEFPGTKDDGNRVSRACRQLTGEQPGDREREILERLLAEAREAFAADPRPARRLLRRAGEMPANADLPPVEVAATAMVVRALLGYEGTLCKL